MCFNIESIIIKFEVDSLIELKSQLEEFTYIGVL